MKKSAIALFFLVVSMAVPTHSDAQRKRADVGFALLGYTSFATEASSPPEGFRKKVFLFPGFFASVRYKLHKKLFVETGLWYQSHGVRYGYAPSFGTQAGNPYFLGANSRLSIPGIPLFLSWSPISLKQHPLVVSLGSTFIFNPFLEGTTFFTRAYTGGTSTTLYTLTGSELETFYHFTVSGKVDLELFQRKRHRLAVSLWGQKGFNRIKTYIFATSLHVPTYDNEYRRESQGDLIAVGLNYHFLSKKKWTIER